jgi:hypothetical protein
MAEVPEEDRGRITRQINIETLKNFEYIGFRELHKPSTKTHVFEVVSLSSGVVLGLIKWYAPWRTYCFFPEPMTVWNDGCLEAVQEKIRTEMRKRQNARSNAEANAEMYR